MGVEWSRLDGHKLMTNNIPSLSIETPISVYHLHNNGHIKTLMDKLATILTQARDITIAKDLLDEPYIGPASLTM